MASKSNLSVGPAALGLGLKLFFSEISKVLIKINDICFSCLKFQTKIFYEKSSAVVILT